MNPRMAPPLLLLLVIWLHGLSPLHLGSHFCSREVYGANVDSDPVILRLDCGTSSSPVAAGYQRMTPDSKYQSQRGYGWLGEAENRNAFHRTSISPLVIWNHAPRLDTVDGIAGRDDMLFRADLPNGLYRVELLLGDLGGSVPAGQGRFLDTGVLGEASGGPGGPLYSMAVESNGRIVAENVEARTYPHRGIVACRELIEQLPEAALNPGVYVRLGNYVRVVFTQQVENGKLVVRFFGDQKHYDQMVQQLRELSDPTVLRQQLHRAGGPFTRNSVLAILIRPAWEPPFMEQRTKRSAAVADPDRWLARRELRAVRPGSQTLDHFARALNQNQFVNANRYIQQISGENFTQVHARILARMWFMGHVNHWDERNLFSVVERELAAAEPLASSLQQRGQLRSLRDMFLDFKRGVMNFDQRTSDGQEMVSCMNRAEAYFARALPGEPLYWKSQLYRARIWYSLDPNRRAQLWPRSQQFIEALDAAYPDNRWADYYLRKDPSGWPLVDYKASSREAPRWAAELHAYYNRMLDLCQWWIDHRQDESTGAIGGEWGDDVEFMPLLAYMGFICPDAAPDVLAGSVRFCEGAWSHSEIVDTFNGFFHITSDAEHSAEFTGNVLGMMLHLRPGDPEYVERSLKTGKLMRDIWMGRNQHGQRLFRSSYLGAFHVPEGLDHGDAAICGRAILPALNVVELNRNPEIARLVIEYADTLCQLARSTAKGKPEWVVPGPVVYKTGELGHTGSTEWWLAEPGSFQSMFSFPKYHGFRLQILTTAWRLTGDRRFLEPIQREAEMATEVPAGSVTMEGSRQWVSGHLHQMGVPQLWDDIQAELQASDAGGRGVLLDKRAVAEEARKLSDVARNRWPMMTDDATMTDRVAFRGCVNPVIWYSGARLTTQQIQPAVSYEGAGRDFAALVLRHNPSYLKLLYFGMQSEERPVRLRFWELRAHATYRIVYGTDVDGDDRIDMDFSSREFVLREPSDSIELLLPIGKTVVVEVVAVTSAKPHHEVMDPAIALRDIQYDARGHLLVDVHNLGNRPAENVSVSFYEHEANGARKWLGGTVVSFVAPPNQLVPQVVRTGIPWSPTKEHHDIAVVLDESNDLEELFERNNEARVLVRP